MSTQAEAKPSLTRKDFVSDQEVRWCPGCGDYAILACLQRTLPGLGSTRENTAFISGIGCSSRLPYYMNTYGFHTIHGRAPAFATGLKLANPELDVWVITGDGDGLSIGGNHMLHVLRRNVNMNIILFNNRIYGLTKGQYSPTSAIGQRSPTSPMGSLDNPLLPVHFALGAGARFIARGVDTDLKHLPTVLTRAHQYQGASFLEVYQNCIVFNDKTFADFTDKPVAADRQLKLEHGKPMIFGKEQNKGLRIVAGAFELEVITLGEDGVTEADVLVHDETNRILAGILAGLRGPDFPVALGVLYCDDSVGPYDAAVHAQVEQAKDVKGHGEMYDLLRSGHTWTVGAN
jgi:2-oxoglutarate ferredoxin oxidoreductase subunit beta